MSYLMSVASSSNTDNTRKMGDPYPVAQDELFRAMYWSVDGQVTEDFSIVSNGATAEVNFRAYRYNTYIAALWFSEQIKAHAGFTYEKYTDYSGVIWTFDIELSATMPVINEPTRAITLEVMNSLGELTFIPLYLYAGAPAQRASRITLDFDNLSNQYGDTVDPTDITRLSIGLVTDSYNQGRDELLTAPIDCTFKLTNVSVVGGAALMRTDHSQPAHNVGMCTSYDDIHTTTPEHIVETMKRLGYNGRVNHYVGMSKYPKRLIDNGVQRNDVTAGNTINHAAERWHKNYFELCHAEGWDMVVAVSFEMFSIGGDTALAQTDWDGQLGRTGYEPPSYLLSPKIPEAMTYLNNVFLGFASFMAASGQQVRMQVGEPWWWWNTDTRKPCIYDFPTKTAYYNETGLFAPDIGLIDDTLTPEGQAYVDWVRDALGQACLNTRDIVKQAYPTAEMTVLFFLPSILDARVGVMQQINYPKAHYQSPNWDFMMTESYDWIIEGDMIQAELGMTVPINDLGYAPDKVEYLAGFVPDAALAANINFEVLDPRYANELWSRVDGSMRTNESYAPARQYIWAYPQVVRDNYEVVPDSGWNMVGDRIGIRPVESSYAPKFIVPRVGPPPQPPQPDQLPITVFDPLYGFNTDTLTWRSDTRAETGAEGVERLWAVGFGTPASPFDYVVFDGSTSYIASDYLAWTEWEERDINIEIDLHIYDVRNVTILRLRNTVTFDTLSVLLTGTGQWQVNFTDSTGQVRYASNYIQAEFKRQKLLIAIKNNQLSMYADGSLVAQDACVGGLYASDQGAALGGNGANANNCARMDLYKLTFSYDNPNAGSTR